MKKEKMEEVIIFFVGFAVGFAYGVIAMQLIVMRRCKDNGKQDCMLR